MKIGEPSSPRGEPLIIPAMRLLLIAVLVACGQAPDPIHVSPAAAPRYRGPIIDFHAHLGTPEQSGVIDGPQGDLLSLDDEAGVTRSALIVIAKKGDPAATRKANDELIAKTTASNGRFFPAASVHPLDGKDALDELARLAARGVRVIKLHPRAQNFDVGGPEVAAVAAKAGELGLVLLFDSYSPTDADEPGKFLMLAITHPTTKFVLAHLGSSRFLEFSIFGMLRKFTYYKRNVWFDLAMTAHVFADSPYEDELVWVTRLIGTDRIVHGSDYPVDSPGHAVADLMRLGYTAEEQQQILHDNAAALLK